MNDLSRVPSTTGEGDSRAAERLLPLIYDELRRLAAHKMAAERPGQSLSPTDLVHEVYLRLIGGETERRYRDQSHFFAAAATAMRRILIDNARKRRAKKHGGERKRVPLGDVAEQDTDLLALEEALQALAARDPVKAQLVELRYFAGLTRDQAAEVLNISPSTADRHWVFARSWLQAEIRGELG